jgi:hypothetical protein
VAWSYLSSYPKNQIELLVNECFLNSSILKSCPQEREPISSKRGERVKGRQLPLLSSSNLSDTEPGRLWMFSNLILANPLNNSKGKGLIHSIYRWGNQVHDYIVSVFDFIVFYSKVTWRQVHPEHFKAGPEV